MIRMLSAYTLEIDDVDAAVAEILAQLRLEDQALERSAGVLTCYAEFIESGVVRALCDALPFDVVGCTTLATATGDSQDMMQLSLSVLTSDTATFAAARTGSIHDPIDMRLRMAEAYQQARGGHMDKPAWIITFFPLFIDLGGQQMLDAFNEVVEGAPFYGTVACDHTTNLSQTQTIFSGEASFDGMSMLLIFDEKPPKFLVMTISEGNVQRQRSLVTRARGNLIMEVNEMPFQKYLDSLGITGAGGDGTPDGGGMPIMLDFNDGAAPLARAVYMYTPEGYAVLGGKVQTGCTLSIGSIDREDVLKTTERAVRKALDLDTEGGMFVIPCVSRALVLGIDTMAEMQHAVGTCGGKLPMHLCYSGGEVCPVYGSDGKPVNRFHNFSCIVCVF